MALIYDAKLRSEYQRVFDTCIIKPDKYTTVDAIIKKILPGRPQYEDVGTQLNIPWYFIAIVHYMEGSSKFTTHLHNGDPLTARTVQVPKGRPVKGSPPFTWRDSAVDALTYEGLNTWPDWDIPGILYKLEGYNGYGYRRLTVPINSPYLWSFSNQYTKGKYVADGHYDPEAVSLQCGAAVLLRRFFEQQIVVNTSGALTLIKQLGALVTYSVNYAVKAEELQKLLVHNGAIIKIDGKAGKNTSDAYKAFTGSFLNGDPRL
jgi:lysozyme family protein